MPYDWGTSEWRAAVRDWVGAEPREQLTRPWSTLWTVDTPTGRLWFKENCPLQRAEPAVHEAVARIAPGYVDPPVAVDSDRGWLLTRDGGPTLAATADSAILTGLLRDYATVQQATIGRRCDLAGLRTAAEPVAAAREQADALAATPAGDPRHISKQDRDRIEAALPALAESAAILAAGPVPSTLDHGDLMPRNVFARRPGGPYRFFDFADAVWAHPFGALHMLMWELRRRWKIPGPPSGSGDDRIRAVFDAYLVCWTDFAPLAELRELAGHALRLAALHRSSAWFRILAGAESAAIARHGGTPWSWLQDVATPVVV